jgi:15-cis-phytoene synthase
VTGQVSATAQVERAYAVCEQVTREQARNFSYGIRLLPTAKRRALSAVYAMARRIDDIGDGDLPDDQKLEALERTQATLHHLDAAGTDPVCVALHDVEQRFPIPMDAFDELVAGCRADVSVHSYETFDDLVGYCRCVAGSVGRLSTGIYRPADLDRCWELADALGVALQLTNILRDLLEDRLAGRVYLPHDHLVRFGCTLDLDSSGHLADPEERFAALVRFEAARAEEWYQHGLRLLPRLDRRSAACTAAMAGIYHRLLARIAADPELVRERRLSLPTTTKLAVAARALVAGGA